VLRATRRLAATLLALAAAITTPAQWNQDDAIHITNRVGFGGSPADRAAVMNNYAAWLNQQLDPYGIPDPDVDALFQAMPSTTLAALQREQFIRAMASNRRLQEVMTYFWERHFNTNYHKVAQRLVGKGITQQVNAAFLATYLEKQANGWHRLFALGSFRTLLWLTTIGPTMTLYLDNDQNQGCQGNENYAREFLELYTMGPLNESTGQQNYTQADVISAARCFSGWDVTMSTWPNAWTTFTAANHCPGPQTLFPAPHTITVPVVGNGSNQLVDLVNQVAASEMTKDFICRKLMRYFLSDAGGTDYLLTQMTTAWGTQGDIRAVLSVLLQSPEFTGTAHRWKRTSTPFERVAWWQRSWDAVLVRTDNFQVDIDKGDVLRDVAADLGEQLFVYPTPDGYPTDSDEQLSAAGAVTSWDYAAKLRTGLDALPVAPGNFYPLHPTVVLALFTIPNTNPSPIASILLTTLYGSNFTALDLQQVTDAIQFDQAGVLLPPLQLGNSFDYAARLAIGAATAGCFLQAQLK
jgi:uncharacterized protein (DUF1800 family)